MASAASAEADEDAPRGKRRVAYFYDEEIGLYHFGPGHPMKPHRARLTFDLVSCYGLADRLDVLSAVPLPASELTRFHADDYIKFLRYATHMVNSAEVGIVGMITNREYKQGVIHRTMRKNLIDNFNHIYILDLHGQVGEILESEEKDENAPAPTLTHNGFQRGGLAAEGSRLTFSGRLHHG